MALEAEPCQGRIYRHPGGIAEYPRGNGSRLPGLQLAGSSQYGVSMNSCVETAKRRVDETVAELALSS